MPALILLLALVYLLTVYIILMVAKRGLPVVKIKTD